MSDLEIRVIGKPIPQGSKTAGLTMMGGKPRAYLRDSNAATLKVWRQEVTTATRNATGATPGWAPLDGPLEAELVFYFERPSSHYGTGRNAHLLKPAAPTWVAVKPDIDKLLRSTFDGLTDGGAYVDDSRIARVSAEQLYAGHGIPPGVHIRLSALRHADTPPPPSHTDPPPGALW